MFKEKLKIKAMAGRYIRIALLYEEAQNFELYFFYLARVQIIRGVELQIADDPRGLFFGDALGEVAAENRFHILPLLGGERRNLPEERIKLLL
ncbi:hypothetical protein COU12_01770 [Candidatus Jorgensenbacteria bacterium CG10_big_fil_rev_8_21_14_0_10_54_38]|uniref:Uncharacterized protein n=1 Tax=Candidatus Jorgensenbacteria bacterium CG10_big_fil_rev_8_21_14_0_10_54_38 TaxID=1974593 RepID=A0A2M6WG06_9BACT|nr:MAG: hypothetical protein COU12_01770 [Candidatus Jorgensenbacteria bacterium CG10_big_fil_rev_8_21_14_0_10_54_38]